MRIASITAGAAGMICGSCIHDNALVTALSALGHDAVLVPTYTPIRTDDADVSMPRVFLGGLNVYLNFKSDVFRRLPRFVHWLLDRPPVLRGLARVTATPDYSALGELTISVLRGEQGRQHAEFQQLVRWLALEYRPEVVTLSNVLLSGLAPALKESTKVPILAYLQGDDIFLDALSADHRRQCLELIRANARAIDGFIATSRFYADYMAGYLGVPRQQIEVIYPGLSLKGHGRPRAERTAPPYVVGYFARIAPEKGLHVLAEAFVRLGKKPGAPRCRLRASGWLGPQHRPYLAEVRKTLAAAGRGKDFEYVESPEHAGKIAFLRSLDVLSVPATYQEPKGLYVLEALANGVPVVQPAHGSFPELVDATGGGVLVPPNDPDALADGLLRLLSNTGLRIECGRKGRKAVHAQFAAEHEARRTADHFRQFLR